MKQRHERLVQLLREHGELDVAALVRELGASEATIRRDLNRLDAEGFLARTFGGARLVESSSLVVRTFEQKRDLMRQEKERIARAAVQYVKPGMGIALDSGSTTWCVAAALKEKGPLTIVTSALPVIEELGSCEDMEIICVGGRFDLPNLDFVGPDVVQKFAAYHVDIAFLGVDSLVPGRGAFASTPEAAAIIGATGACADQRIVVLDHSKINAPANFLGIAAADITRIVTDRGLPADVEAQLRQDPYELDIVE